MNRIIGGPRKTVIVLLLSVWWNRCLSITALHRVIPFFMVPAKRETTYAFDRVVPAAAHAMEEVHSVG